MTVNLRYFPEWESPEIFQLMTSLMSEKEMMVLILSPILSTLVFLSLSFWIVNLSLHWYGTFEPSSTEVTPWRCLLAVICPVIIILRALKNNSLNQSGAIAAFIVGFVATISNYCFFACLLTFFIVGSKATKFRSSRKQRLEDDFKEGGQRNWIQVLCNSGRATEAALLYIIDVGCTEVAVDFSRNYNASWYMMTVVGALACSCGDTLASELGSVIGSSSPRLITTFKKVPRGTNGGISIAGTIFSAIGGLLIGLAFYSVLLFIMPLHYLEESPPQWPVIVIGTLAGLIGSIIDSILGATLQYSGYSEKQGCIVETPGDDIKHISGVAILDNHSVNLISVLITSWISPRIAFALWAHFPGKT